MADEKKEKTVRSDPFGARSNKTQLADLSDSYANSFENFIQFTSTISRDSVKFKAFLTNFEDQFSSEWNSEQVYGRNDPIQTFKNTTRTISIGWDTPAASVVEGRDNMIRASKLIRMLYPGYENHGSVSTINRAPLIRVKFRNLIKNYSNKSLLVTIDSINFAPDLEAGWFDKDTSFNAGDPSDQLMPKLLKFSCTLTVLHTKTVGHFGRKWSSDQKNFPNLPDKIRNDGQITDPDFENSGIDLDISEQPDDFESPWGPIDNDDEFETSDESAKTKANNEGIDLNDTPPADKAMDLIDQGIAGENKVLGIFK